LNKLVYEKKEKLAMAHYFEVSRGSKSDPRRKYSQRP
jgi:hypothetical protein